MKNKLEYDNVWQESDSQKIDPPLPLFRDLPTGEKFPLESLGNILEQAAHALHSASGAPEGLIGQSLVAASALATQAHADVVMDGRRSPSSIFCVSIGASGERKSFIDSEALKPHREFEERKVREYADAIRDFNAEFEAYEIVKRNTLSKSKSMSKEKLAEELKKIGEEPKYPTSEIMLMEEPTYEGIVKALESGRPSVGIFSDEGGRLLGGHAMNKDNQLKTIGGFCGLWDGKPISRTRAGEGSTKIYGKRLSLHLMIQPRVSELLLGNEIILDQGFLSRCLMVAPETNIGKRPYKHVNLNNDLAILKYRETMDSILSYPLPLSSPERNELSPRLLVMEESASRLWIQFHDYVEGNMLEGKKFSSIRGFASKAAEQALRLAGVLMLVENIEACEIKHDKLESTIHLMDFYLSEFLRLREIGLMNPDLLLAQKLLNWCRDFQEVYLVQIYQRGPFQVRDKATAKRVIRILEEHRHLKKVQGGKEIEGKHRNDVWVVSHAAS